MSMYTQMQITNLKQLLKVLCQQIVGNVRNAIDAVTSLDEDLAQSVVKRNQQIVRLELDVIQACKDLLANDKVMPTDLQVALSMLRLNADLERIAKQAVVIAHHIVRLQGAKHHNGQPPLLHEEATAVTDLVQRSIDSLITENSNNARAALTLDDRIGDCFGELYGIIQASKQEDPQQSSNLDGYLQLAKDLERLANHAVTLCHDIIEHPY